MTKNEDLGRVLTAVNEDIEHQTTQEAQTEVREAIVNGGGRYATAVSEAIDSATGHIVDELDQLIKEVDTMKARVIANGAAAKASMAEHFNLGSEATTMARDIRDRLANIEAGAEGAKLSH